MVIEPDLNDTSKARDELIASLQERAKELNCLYEVEKLLNQSNLALEEGFREVVKVIAPGWQYPDICWAQISHAGKVFQSGSYSPTPWVLNADIMVQEEVVGTLSVFYAEERPPADEGPFLREELRLIRSIADRLGHFIFFQRVRDMRQNWKEASRGDAGKREWRVAVRLMRSSDKQLYLRITRKMLNYLSTIGIVEAQALLQQVDDTSNAAPRGSEINVPGERGHPRHEILLSDKPFELAAEYLSDQELLQRVQKWMQEDKASFFIKMLSSPRSSLPEIADALRRYIHVIEDGGEALPISTLQSMRVSLAQRFLTEQHDFIRVAKDYVRIIDFNDLLDRIIMPADSHGRLGGKGAGLLLAQWILQHGDADTEELPIGAIKVPKTWYIASDGILDFIGHNDLEDVIKQKFKEIDQVRREYPNIVQLFKNSAFPSEIVKGLSVALDEFGDAPIIVRSSSLLEDRLGTAFSGKYKSLFLANQGSKHDRLEALLDAVAEVYASVFGPDPIEYRRERGLLEFSEEMGILIQEVVGTRVGRYFLPAFAGVAFSRNEFRWSPRITRDDGLIRLVPGLGTRAVDRTSDYYPTLVVPGKPNLRVNVATDEIVRYAPKKIDVIDLQTNTLVTKTLQDLLRECGDHYPALEKVFSVLHGDMLKMPVRLMVDPLKDDLVTTFEGLFTHTHFVTHVGNIMRILEAHLKTPVDIEFAHDGNDFYLLQCRPQSYEVEGAPAPIPKEVPEQNILFTAHRYVSNGWVPDITHIVYVDPARYAALGEYMDLANVAQAVGQLNKLLPKRQFILMGPGRWGSRGDIKLGVKVTYADISNAAMLVEIARKSGSYVPDLSFGTHFFQDLVESHIRYLPLYPDDPGIKFNERFLLGSKNLLPEILPEFAKLADTLHVIDVPAAADGRVLRVLMNADLDEALGLLSRREERGLPRPETEPGAPREPVQYWRWRMRMAEHIAACIDPERFGVVAMYAFGSTKNASAGPGSDIDLLLHFRGEEKQRCELINWLEGWSLCLAEMNYLRTGYRSDGLLDVHIVTDEDIAQHNSYAAKIGAVTDPARELPMKHQGREPVY
jgi:pyruvate,water dikinase